jgi:hypothetical protein
MELTTSILDPLESSVFPRSPSLERPNAFTRRDSIERAVSSNTAGPSCSASICGAKIPEYAYPLAFHVPMKDLASTAPNQGSMKNFGSTISFSSSFEISADDTADAELQAAFHHWRRRLVRLVESVPFNMLTILIVSIDIASTIYFEFFVDEDSKDCFGRDMAAEANINITVMVFFSVELFLRVLSQVRFASIFPKGIITLGEQHSQDLR